MTYYKTNVICIKVDYMLCEDEGRWVETLMFSDLLCPLTILSNPNLGSPMPEWGLYAVIPNSPWSCSYVCF